MSTELTTTVRTLRDVQSMTREATVTGAEPIPWGYGPGRLWRITHVFVRFERFRTDGGPWQDWSRDKIILTGRNVKADGSDGAERTEQIWVDERLTAEVEAWLEAVRAELESPTIGEVPA